MGLFSLLLVKAIYKLLKNKKMKTTLKKIILSAVIFGSITMTGSSCMSSRGASRTNDGPWRGKKETNDNKWRGRGNTDDRGKDRTMVILEAQDIFA